MSGGGLPIGWVGGSTFAGVPFGINQVQYQARPLPDVSVEYVLTPVPGGDTSILQILGAQSPEWSQALIVASTEWDSMKSKVGVQGTLTVLGAAPRVATLVGLTGINDVNLQGFVLCTGKWVVS